MRTLILGGTGMLGRAVVGEARAARYPALALSHRQADVTDPAALAYWVDAFRPELVVNCAALTKVDLCEERREEALAVNGEGVANVVAAAKRAGARLIHLSSDYVFDGEAKSPYDEDAPTRPLSVYGESKLAGERHARAYERALVVRASWLFGPGGPNFAATIVRIIAGGQRVLRVVGDQVGCPTYTRFLARALWDLARAGTTGLVHYRNREPVSWHGFAAEIARLRDPSVEVVPITTAEYPLPARRPAYSVLGVGRVERLLGRQVEPWGWGLAEYLTEGLAHGAPGGFG
jgi:dTDP-4-dehydrorhamnose reductase